MGLFGPFDWNHDGRVNAWDAVLEIMAMDHFMGDNDDEDGENEEDEDA